MGWARFDDQFTDHPKVLAVPPLAELLAMRAIIYCARYETDGHVRASVLGRIASDLSSPKKLAGALVDEGLWDVDADGDGWWVHDYLEYQPSATVQAEKRDALSAKRSAAGRKGGLKSAESRASKPSKPEAKGEPKPEAKLKHENEANASTGAKQNPTPDPDPVPDPLVNEPYKTGTALSRNNVSSLAPKTERPRNHHYDATCLALDLPPDSSESSLVGKIAARAKSQGHEPDEILRRAALHLATFNFPLTAASLSKRWDQLGSKVTTATPAEKRQVQVEIQRMRQREQILAAAEGTNQ